MTGAFTSNVETITEWFDVMNESGKEDAYRQLNKNTPKARMIHHELQ